MPKPHVLSRLKIRFGSLVDQPANPGATIALFKMVDPSPVDVEKVGRKVSATRLGRMKTALKALQDAMADLQGDEEEEDSMSKKISEEVRKALPDEVRTYLEGVEADAVQLGDVSKQVDTLTAQIATLQKGGNGDEPAPEPTPDPVPEAVQKRLDDLQKQADEFKALAKAERDQRETAEATAKAREFLPELGNPDILGPILKRAGDNDLTDADRVELLRVMKSAAEQLRQSKLFSETGGPGSKVNTGGATDRIDILAKAMVADKRATDYGDAITKLQADPEHRATFSEYMQDRQ